MSKAGVKSRSFDVSPQQAQAALRVIAETERRPPQFSFSSRDCGYFAADVLRAAGLGQPATMISGARPAELHRRLGSHSEGAIQRPALLARNVLPAPKASLRVFPHSITPRTAAPMKEARSPVQRFTGRPEESSAPRFGQARSVSDPVSPRIRTNIAGAASLSAMPTRSFVVQKMDVEMDIGSSGFGRPDFRSGTATWVTNDVNSQMTSWGQPAVSRKDYDVAHKVSFEVIRDRIMSYLYYKGSATEDEIKMKTNSLYTQDRSRYHEMKQKRGKLFWLIDHYGNLNKGQMLIIDAANALLTELNSAKDNLGLGYPKENRSLGSRPDPVIRSYDPTTDDLIYSPRTDAIDDAWDLTTHMAFDSSGWPRTSQVTSWY